VRRSPRAPRRQAAVSAEARKRSRQPSTAAAVFVPLGIVVLAMRTRRLASADAKAVSGPAPNGTRPTAR
jgi:hypothetical protein